MRFVYHFFSQFARDIAIQSTLAIVQDTFATKEMKSCLSKYGQVTEIRCVLVKHWHKHSMICFF